MKLRLITFSIFFILLFSSMVFASFTGSGSFVFVVPDNIPDTIASRNLTINNGFSEYNITTLSLEFVPDTGELSHSISLSAFTYAFSSIVIKSGLNNVSSVGFKIPLNIPAIDEDDDIFKTKVWSIGKLKITGTKINKINGASNGTESFEVPVTIEVKNNFGFYKDKVEIEIGDADPVNVSDGTTKKPAIDEDVAIVIRYENSFEKSEFNFKSDDIEAKLYLNDDEVDSFSGDDDVDSEEVGTMSFDIDLGDFEPGDEVDVKIELTGVDNFGSLHGEVFEFKLDIQEETESSNSVDDSLLDDDDDGIPNNVDLCPNTPPGCIVEFDGCRIDFDGDGFVDCTGSFSNNKKNSDSKNVNVNNNVVSNNEENEPKKEVIKEEAPKESGEDGALSFIFGLVVGVVGTALFFVLTRV